jgi:hypothetical protein
MKGDILPDPDHVVRYVKATGIAPDGSINGSEFQLRGHRSDEQGLSVNWLDFFRSLSKAEQVAAVRRLVRLQLRPSACFAELNVGRTKAHLAGELPTLLFIEDPLHAEHDFPADPSHSLIVGAPRQPPEMAELIGDLIAECVVQRHPARV